MDAYSCRMEDRVSRYSTGDYDESRECAVGVNSDNLHVLTDVRLANATLQTLAARHVHLRRDEIAFLYAGDFVADGRYLAAEFVAGNQRRMNALLRPRSQLRTCKSVPQMDATLTLTRTSLRPNWGLGTSRILRPGRGMWVSHGNMEFR